MKIKEGLKAVRIVSIIQARTGSTRLPGKVMKNLCNQTVLAHVVNRVKACDRVDEIIVATTDLNDDDCIVEESQKLGVMCFRGSRNNVLERYYLAAKKYRADAIMRITSDCPLLDVEILNNLLSYFQEESEMGLDIDYLSNTLMRDF
ncbi:MAG: cytidylyltransferase domain-containing protein, partial [Microcystaceae cyanobacterium]